MRAYAAAGHFKAGSMGPKVEACLRFVDAGGEIRHRLLIEVGPAMAGRAGTHIVPDAPAKKATKRSAGAGGKTAARATATKKTAATKAPPKRTRRGSGTTGGADVIDITTGRRSRRRRVTAAPAARRSS